MGESKRCTKCGEVKPLTEFSRNKNTKDGLHSACKKCERESRIRKHPEIKRIKNINSDPNIRICIICGKEKPISSFEKCKRGKEINIRRECNDCLKNIREEIGNTGSKICTKCGIEKPIAEFGDYKPSRDGKNSRCRECVGKWYERYYDKNREHIIYKARKYEKDNKEIVRERKRKYREENKDHISKWQKNYGVENRPRLNKYSKEYREKNLESCNAIAKRYKLSPKGKASLSRVRHKRRSRNKNLKNDLSLRQWDTILYDQQHNLCVHCGREFGERLKPTKDHIVPLLYEWFGLTFGNVQALCSSCNGRRKKRLFLGNAIDNLLVDDI